MQLHAILMLQEKMPAPSVTLNGTFIYQLCADLVVRKNPLMFIQDLFGKSSSMLHCFELITNHIFESSGAAFNTDSSERTKKSRKRGKRKLEHVQPKHESDSDSPSRWEANCDLSNKFSQLMADT
jgi:hypothetical protein